MLNLSKTSLHCSSIVLNFERVKAGHRDEHWSPRTSAAERINLHVQQLPQPLQHAALHFVACLAAMLQAQAARKDELLWPNFSFAQALHGL